MEQIQTFEVLKSKAKEIQYGDLPVVLIVFDGEIIGYDQKEPSVIKFREKSN